MDVLIIPGNINGEVVVPASKSYAQRAFAAALLRAGETRIEGLGFSEDEHAALNILRACGADVVEDFTSVTVRSEGLSTITQSLVSLFDAGESGLASRMFTPILALRSAPFVLEGSGTLRDRPFDFFEKYLPQLDVALKSNFGKLPLQVSGPLVPCDISIPGNESSQYASGLMMAFAASCSKEVTLTVTQARSTSYLDLTKNVLQDFGFDLEEVAPAEYLFRPLRQNLSGSFTYHIEADWSNAAFWLVAAAVFGGIRVLGLNPKSLQGDRAILEVLQGAGAEVVTAGNELRINAETLSSFCFDATDTPDLFPPLALLAAFCQGQSRIRGVHRLLHKESNRADALISEFTKMQIPIFVEEDVLMVEGAVPQGSEYLSGWNDHRIVMTLSLLALRAESASKINGVEAVNKSYPLFYDHLKKLGAHFQIK